VGQAVKLRKRDFPHVGTTLALGKADEHELIVRRHVVGKENSDGTKEEEQTTGKGKGCGQEKPHEQCWEETKKVRQS